jgi:hypothetical protein
LFDGSGWTAAHAHVGPFDWQKLSKKEVSQPESRQTPHTPQEEHGDMPEQSLLCTVDASVPESMNEDFNENADLLQSTAVGTGDALWLWWRCRL